MRRRTPRVVCDGNSLSTGYSGQTSYPSQMQPLTGRSPVYGGIATVGITTEELVSRYASLVAPYYRPGVADTLVVWETRNSMYYAATPRAAVDSTWQYVSLARATGWGRVLVGTVIASVDGGALTQSDITTANALLRSECASQGATLVDLAADPRLDDYTDLTYYLGDQVHLTTAGYGVVAGLVADALGL